MLQLCILGFDFGMLALNRTIGCNVFNIKKGNCLVKKLQPQFIRLGIKY